MNILSLTLSFLLTLSVSAAFARETALSTYEEQSSSSSVKATWPRSGLARPDREADELVRNAVSDFRDAARQELASQLELRAEEPDMPLRPCEMILEGSLSDNGKVTSVVWKNYQYLGGAHGNLTLAARHYATADGSPVLFKNLFRKPEKALQLMSRLSRTNLAARGLPLDMVEPGTTPEEENFQTFTLEKDGITLSFAPYQVAPWSEGVVTLFLSLRDLADAEPRRAYWP